MFNKKSIYKITDDRGNILFTNNIKLMNNNSLIKTMGERQKTLSSEEQITQYIGAQFLKILLVPVGFYCMIWFLALIGWNPGG